VLTLTGANTYSGGTTVNGGKLVASVNGLNGGPVAVASGATITFTGNNQVSTSAVSGAGAILNDSANTIIFNGDHSGFTGAFTHSAGANNTQFNSSTSGSQNASYTLSAGELIFAANGDYTVKFGSLASTAGNIRGGNSATTATGTTTLEVGALGANTSIAGNLNNGANAGSKVIALNKVGSGTLTISGNNTFSGGATVNAGALTINGALTAASNAVNAASGGTLGGNGTIAGAVTVSGTLSPGDTVGVLTASGALTLNSGSTTRLEINGLARGTEHDGVNIGGAFTQGGTLHLSFGASIAEGSYTLFQIGGTSSGAFSSVTAASAATPTPVSLTDSGGVWTGTLNGVSLSFNSTTGVLTTSGAATHTDLQTWRFDQFGVYDDTAGVLAGDTEDYDGDGLANLLEYALGADPKVAGSSPVTVARAGGVLTLTYSRRSPADPALTYTVEGSDNLTSGFTPAGGSTNTVGSTSTYTDNVNVGTAGTRRFLRLSVTYTAP
jgi:autotransporter-associated beta strand protein